MMPTQLGKSKTLGYRPRLKGRVLVVEATGYSVRAAVVSIGNGPAALQAVTESSLADPHQAAREATEKLKATVRRLPRHGLVLTAQAVAGVIELPVSPQQPRPAAQMQELVRWELEPTLAQALAGRPLGTIMVGRGHLSNREATEVGRAMGRPRQSPAAAASATAGMRFGDTAIELGYAGRAAVDECLRIQEWFQVGGDHYVCGWSPAGREPISSGTWRWFASAISREARDQWAETLDKLGLRLKAIYPTAGASATCGHRSAESGEAARTAQSIAIVEIDPDQLTCTHLSQDGLTGFQHRQSAGGSDQAETIADLTQTYPSDRVVLCGTMNEPDELTRDVGAMLGIPTAVMDEAQLAAGQPDPPLHARARLLGAAVDAGPTAAHTPLVLPAMTARDPAPPLARRPIAWWAAAACLLVALLLGVEADLQTELNAAGAEARQLENDLDQIETHIRQTEAYNQRVADLQQTLAELDDARRRVDQQLNIFTSQLAHRSGLLDGLLRALTDLTPPNVAIDRLARTDAGSLELSGWAMSQRVPEAFAERLNNRLASWGMAVTSQSTQRRTGRLALPGYGFRMQFDALDTSPTEPLATELVEGDR